MDTVLRPGRTNKTLMFTSFLFVYNPMFTWQVVWPIMMVQCSFRPLPRSLLGWVGLVGLVGCTSAAGAQGQSILSTVQPQQLPAIDLLHISNLTFDHCICVYEANGFITSSSMHLNSDICTSIPTFDPQAGINPLFWDRTHTKVDQITFCRKNTYKTSPQAKHHKLKHFFDFFHIFGIHYH